MDSSFDVVQSGIGFALVAGRTGQDVTWVVVDSSKQKGYYSCQIHMTLLRVVVKGLLVRAIG